MFAADSKVVSAPSSDSAKTEGVFSWKQIMDPVEPFLDAVAHRLATQVEDFEPDVVRYADYALNGQGKHLRAALVALTANSLDNTNDSHITAAVIIEMVHLATLVHDDVIDEAQVRRGRLTLAANWSNEIAVLFGDCLFAHALKLAASFPTPDVCRAVAVATSTVCSGEILQTQHRRDFNFTRERYFRVIEMKTAELFALSCDLAASFSGATPELRGALREFGLAFGTAYQVYDDCVDVFGSETAAGKSLGTDLAKGKLTLPMLLLLERANGEDRARVKDLIGNWRNDSVKPVSELLMRYDTLAGSLEIIQQYLQKACALLKSLPSSNGRTGLVHLTDYLARQTDALGSSD